MDAVTQLRPALLALVIAVSSGALERGCRGKGADNTSNNSNARNGSNTQTNSNAERVVAGQELKLKYGQEVAVEGEGLKVGFEAVVADSRCPVNVTCIWEGDAEVRLEVRAASGGEASPVTLHTSGRFGCEARHAGHVFKLVGLAPQPRADAKTNPSDYVLTLTVNKE